MLSLACEGARDTFLTRHKWCKWWAADVVVAFLDWHVKAAVVLSVLGIVPDSTLISGQPDAAVTFVGEGTRDTLANQH